MRPQSQRDTVAQLHQAGLNSCQIARETQIPRSTVREWIDPRYTPQPQRAVDLIRLPKHDYAYLLGIYLGDGTISRHRRGIHRLRIFMDSRYPLIIEECRLAIEAVMPRNQVNVRKLPYNAVEISCYSKLWPTLFPQAGPGLKHARKIELAPWQERAVARFPREFLRGLIQSDGCRVLNRVNGSYYPRYFFAQVSDDIRRLFCDCCDQLEVEWKQNRWNSISIARRASVARLDLFVGPKYLPAERRTGYAQPMSV
jgi:hypothetical protein